MEMEAEETSRELLFIVNPVAGHGRSRRVFARLEAVLARVTGLRWVVWNTRGPGHAVELAQRAGLEGYRRVVAVGGDGTVHEAINGLMSLSAALRHRLAFGVVPAGSGNDFARNVGIPQDPGALAALLASGAAGFVDVGEVGGHYFANVAGVGFDAEVARLANRLPKAVPGPLTYLVSAVSALATYRNASVRIELDGRELRRRVLLVAVGNGAGYGGGMLICPGARMDDGRFRVVVAGDLSRAAVLATLPRVFSGRHLENPLVEAFEARQVHIEAERPLAVQADGEVVARTPATLKIVPRALRVIGVTGPEREAGLPFEAVLEKQGEPPVPETEATAPPGGEGAGQGVPARRRVPGKTPDPRGRSG